MMSSGDEGTSGPAVNQAPIFYLTKNPSASQKWKLASGQQTHDSVQWRTGFEKKK